MFFIQLRNELWKLFGKKRTYIGFGMCLLAESVILFLFRYTKGPRREIVHRLEVMGYDPNQFITALTMATMVLIPVAYALLPLYVSLVGGDLVAKEAEDGSLRMILARPISRLRIVGIKWLAGVVFSMVLAVVMGVCGFGVASMLFPHGGLCALLPSGIFSVFGEGDGLRRFAMAIVVLGAKAVTIMSLSWMFSCCNVKPAAATILGISVVLTSRIIQEIPYFHEWQEWFITYHLDLWLKTFQQPAPLAAMAQSLCILLGINVTVFIIGAAIFHTRDIKS